MTLSLVFEEEQCINSLLLRLLERRVGITAISGFPAERIELFLFSQYFCSSYFCPRKKKKNQKKLFKGLTVSRGEINILYKGDQTCVLSATETQTQPDNFFTFESTGLHPEKCVNGGGDM